MKEQALVILIVLTITIAIALGLDKSFDNKDTMLCNSAKVSRNDKYLEKCECFYKGESIRCIYE